MDITIVKPIIEACTGEDLITGEDLTDMERGLKVVFAMVDLVTLGGAIAATKFSEMGLKEGLKAFGKTALIDFAGNTAACGVGALGETFDWPVPITMMLSLAAGITVSISGNKLLFKNADGIEIGSKTLSDDDLKIVEQTIEGENYSNLTEVVSAKEAEVYLHFLESGSTEEMTESELKAVQKIEELIKSNKIDYDGILKIRNETVKSDVEVVRKTTEDSVEDVGKSAAEDAGKIVESGLNSIDDIALKHSSVGDFTYNPKTGQISRMKGGGHGQSNIKFLEENGIEYNIVKEYDNGVRVGNVPKHKTPSKRTGTGQAWFPKNWSDSKIKEAGNYVTNLPDNKNLPDGVIGYGEYDGVRVGIIKTDGKIGTIFPDADLQP